MGVAITAAAMAATKVMVVNCISAVGGWIFEMKKVESWESVWSFGKGCCVVDCWWWDEEKNQV